MTNQQPPREELNGQSLSFRDKVWRIVKQPRTQIIAVVGLGAIAIGGYIGGRLIITKVLPPRVEEELEKLLARDVSLGEVKVDGLNQIIVDDFAIAATEKDGSHLEIDAIKIDVNLWPLFIKGRVFLDIVVDDVKGYAQLDTLLPEPEEKKPFPESLLLPPLPITTDITLRLQNTKLAVAPNAKSEAIKIDTQGKLEFLYDKKKQPLNYQIEHRIGNSNINIEGETLLSNIQSQNQIKINNLYLPEVVSIIPQLPVDIKQGILNTNLAINIPSLAQLKESTAKGNITIANLTGKVDSSKIKLPPNSPVIPLLEKDFAANVDIDFNQQLATIAQANLDWGEVNAKAEGKVSLQQGYSLQANLVSLPIDQILPLVGVTLPVNLNGLVSSQIKITGEIDNPIINGNLHVAKSSLDKIDLGKIESQFTATLEELNIRQVSIKPTFGGKITSQALIKANLRETVLAGKPLQPDQTRVNLKFLANLPPNPLFEVFKVSDYGIDFGNLTAKGEIKGSLNQPQGLISFAIPQIEANNFKGVKAEGKLVINQQKVELVDTQLVADNNPIKVDGSGDFKTKKWQVSVTGKDFNLTPFVTQFCDNNSACISAQVNTNLPIILTRLDSNFQGSLTSFHLKDIEGKGDINIQVNDGSFKLDSTLVKGKLLVNGNASDIALSQIFPSLPTSVNVVNSKINLSTDVEELLTIDQKNNLPPSFSLEAESQLDVDTGKIEAAAKINSQKVNITADVRQIPFTQIIPSLPAEVTSGEIKINADTQELYQLATQRVKYDGLLSLDSLNVTANVDSKVANGDINGVAKVNNGIFTAEGVASNVVPFLLLPGVNFPADNFQGNFKGEAKLSELISFGVNYLENKTVSRLPSLRANAEGKLNIGEGQAIVAAKVENNQWQTNIDTDNINLEYINQGLSLDENLGINLASVPNFSSSINLRGSLDNFYGKNISLPVEIKPTSLALGENIVELKGNFEVVNILQQPDIDNLRLQVATESQFNTILVREIFPSVYSNQGINLVPAEIKLKGQAEFSGVITGNNLLTNPLGENGLNLLGDASLSNFKIDQLEFEPYLTGKVTINPQSKISLDLKGKQDVISASWVKDGSFTPAIESTFAYIPQNIEIRQGGEDGFSLLGNRQGNELLMTINNLPLENLQLQPAVNYGIDGKLKGNLSTEIALNLNNFNARGNISLKQPGLDFFEAKEISGGFAYQDNIASLDDGVLKFGNTEYNLTGKFNLKTQDIAAKVDLQGDVEDIFTTLKIADVETLTAFVQELTTRDAFAQADDIPSQSVGKGNNTIASQVNLLNSIDQQIKAIAKQVREGKLPNNLDIVGDYQGEIIIGGNLKNPAIDFNLTGDKWQWSPQQEFPNLVDSLGLVMEYSETIAIPKVSINASFQNNNLTLKPFLIKISGSEISFAGDISAQSQNGEFKIKQFPLDLITQFFPLALDVDTIIDVEGTIKGRFINPEIKGVLTLNNTAIDNTIIEEKITSDFNYSNYQLDFKTTSPEYITFNAQLPYNPVVENDKPAFINLELNQEVMEIVGLLTEGKITLSEGKFNSKLNVEIDSLNKLIKDFNLEGIKIAGNINFKETQINSIFLNEAVYLSGEINLLDNQVINIDNLVAKVNNTDINVQGKLPVLKPIEIEPENILAINIPDQSLKLEGLYSGNVNANILINGTALNPKIGGYLTLNNGDFSIPSPEEVDDTNNLFLWNKWLGDSSKKASNSILQPNLDNFVLTLDNTQLVQMPLYRFLFGGELTISGSLLDIDNLSAQGVINLRRGAVYLGGATVFTGLATALSGTQTTFYLSRTNENNITFNPNRPILNPELDIQAKADIVDYSRVIPNTQRNEVNDPIIRTGRGENIQVVLDIEGGLAQLLPVLSGSIERSCNFPVDDTIAEEVKVPSEKLASVGKCVNLAVTNANLSNVDLLSSPLISLSSIPNRSEGELINLIVGGQLVNLASQLQRFSSADLLQNGLVGLILTPLANNLSFGINETVSTWGRPLGMDDVRIFPLVEGVYKIKEQSSVSISYDYIYSEAKVRYNIRF